MIPLIVEDDASIRDTRAGKRTHGPGGQRVDPDPARAEVGGQIADRGFEGCLGDTHHIVGGNPARRAAIGERQQRAAVGHQFRCPLSHLREREAGDDHRVDEVIPAGIGIAAMKLAAIGKRQCVDDEIEAAPNLLDLGKSIVDGRGIADIARNDNLRADRLGEWNSPPPESLALVGEGKLRTLPCKYPRNAPGNGALIGHAHDEASLACHKRTRPGYIGLGHRSS